MSTADNTSILSPTIVYFIKNYINSNPIIRSTCLDRTIKAIINYLSYNPKVVEYLNRVRVIYFLKRAKYLDSKTYKIAIG